MRGQRSGSLSGFGMPNCRDSQVSDSVKTVLDTQISIYSPHPTTGCRLKSCKLEGHFGKCSYLFSCEELDERLPSKHMFVL